MKTVQPNHQPQAKKHRATHALLEKAERYYAAGQILEAQDHFDRAVEADKASPAALSQAGNFYFKQQQPRQAIPLFSRVTQLDPNNALAWRNLGVGYSAAGEYAAAIAAFENAVRLKPDYAAAHHALALSLMAAGQLHRAIPAFQAVIRLTPQDAEALYNFANALVLIGETAAAETALQVAIAHNPNFADAHCNLGKLYYTLNQTALARQHLTRAVELAPNSAIAHKNLGAVLQHEGRLSEALWFYEAALELQPDFSEVLGNIGSVQLALGDVDAATASYRQSLRLNPNNAAVFSDMLFCLQNDHCISNERLFAEHRAFADQFEAPHRANWPQHQNDRDPHRKLRIGYVSGDLRHHALAFFLEPLLALRDREAFEIHIYANHAQVDDVTRRLASYVDAWTPCLHLSDTTLAQKIMADGIDILVDLSGHTAYNRLPMFALKPAPIQATFMGYGGTSGLDAIDYRITDAWLDPVGESDQWNSEILIRLPGGGAAFEGSTTAPEPGALPALAGKGVVLACLNNPRKIRPPVVSLWSTILAATPDATLLLGSASDESLIRSLLAQFADAGVDKSRIAFQPWMPLDDYLALHQSIDIALDPFPYNGGTTSYHSLWMGVPVVTLAGTRSMSRCGAAILASVGLDDWVTHSESAYVTKVLDALSDLPRLAALRSTLRSRITSIEANRSARVTAALEAAYRGMWQNWCARDTAALRS